MGWVTVGTTVGTTMLTAVGTTVGTGVGTVGGIVLGVVAGLLLLWAVLVGVLWLAKPDEVTLRDALRLLPDVARLLARLARAPEVPRRIRLVLLLLLGYLASPIDLVPDFIPVLGYADDAVVVAVTLRWVVRHAGVEAVAARWPGTPDGLDALLRLARVPR